MESREEPEPSVPWRRHGRTRPEARRGVNGRRVPIVSLAALSETGGLGKVKAATGSRERGGALNPGACR